MSSGGEVQPSVADPFSTERAHNGYPSTYATWTLFGGEGGWDPLAKPACNCEGREMSLREYIPLYVQSQKGGRHVKVAPGRGLIRVQSYTVVARSRVLGASSYTRRRQSYVRGETVPDHVVFCPPVCLFFLFLSL